MIDVIRVWYGPLPDFICTPMQVIRHTFYMMASLLWTVVALLKVWIVCVRKSVPTMDDNFVVVFVTRASFMMSFLFSLVGVILPQKPAFWQVSHLLHQYENYNFTGCIFCFFLFQWICNGQYGPKEHELKRTFPVAAILIGIGF